MGTRDERVDDLFFGDSTSAGAPSEEGQVRRVSGDLVAFVGGQVRSLTVGGSTPPAAGAIMMSLDGVTYTAVVPVTSSDGWLANEDGELLVEGIG